MAVSTDQWIFCQRGLNSVTGGAKEPRSVTDPTDTKDFPVCGVTDSEFKP